MSCVWNSVNCYSLPQPFRHLIMVSLSSVQAELIDAAGQRPARPLVCLISSDSEVQCVKPGWLIQLARGLPWPSVTGAAVFGAECERGPLIIGHKMWFLKIHNGISLAFERKIISFKSLLSSLLVYLFHNMCLRKFLCKIFNCACW